MKLEHDQKVYPPKVVIATKEITYYGLCMICFALDLCNKDGFLGRAL